MASETGTTGATGPNYTAFDMDALKAAEDAGINRPASISPTGISSLADLQSRVELLEMLVNDGRKSNATLMSEPQTGPLDYLCAMVDHIMGTHFRTVDRDALVTAYREHREALNAQPAPAKYDATKSASFYTRNGGLG